MAACDLAVAQASNAMLDRLSECPGAYYHINNRSDAQALRLLLATALGEWIRTQDIEVT
jgi:hypothetical protein